MCHLAEEELTIVEKNIINRSTWLSTSVEKNVGEETFFNIAIGSSMRDHQILRFCEYFKVHDINLDRSEGLCEKVLLKYNISMNHL